MHVYVVPTRVVNGGVCTSELSYVCSCNQTAWDGLHGMEMLEAAERQLLPSCYHADALKHLHTTRAMPYASSASSGAGICVDDADFYTDAPAAVLLLGQHRQAYCRTQLGGREWCDVVLPFFSCRGDVGSACMAKNRRGIVSVNERSRRYVCFQCGPCKTVKPTKGGPKGATASRDSKVMCAHLKQCAAWLSTTDGLEAHDSMGLGRYRMPNERQAPDRVFGDTADYHCKSFMPIDPYKHVQAVCMRLGSFEGE